MDLLNLAIKKDKTLEKNLYYHNAISHGNTVILMVDVLSKVKTTNMKHQ